MAETALEDILAAGRIRRGGADPAGGAGGSEGVLPIGVPSIDAVLPGGGLKTGATHEWISPPVFGEERPGSAWAPSLAIAGSLARRASRVVWIGRRVWPCPLFMAEQAAPGGGPGSADLSRHLFIDPDCDAARFWAADQALRCMDISVAVIDGTRMDMATSRRLQLAAECGGVTGLVLRPSWERGVISASETRWMVRASPPGRGDERRARWGLELLRCKGARLGAQGLRWIVEVPDGCERDACALRVPADVVGGSGEAAGQEGGRRIA